MTELLPIWSYWEGPQPDWIGLCLETIRRNIPGVQILTRDAWHDLYDGRQVPRDVFNKLPPNAQSDFVRAWLLYHVGGWWIDADAIVFSDPRLLVPHLGQHFASYRAVGTRREWCTALIASEAGTPTAERYLANQITILKAGPLPRRNALGPHTLWPALGAYPQHVQELPAELIHPWPYWLQTDPDAITRPGTDVTMYHLVRRDAVCFMLTHKALGQMVYWPREQLLASYTLPAACWRRALNQET